MKGAVLVYVLWLLTAASALTMVMFSLVSFSGLRKDANLARWVFLYEAEAVARIAVSRFNQRYFFLQGEVSNFGEEVVTYDGREYRVFIEPEDALLPVNVLSSEAIVNFLVLKGVDRKRATEIALSIKLLQEKGMLYPSALYWAVGQGDLYNYVSSWLSVYSPRLNLNYADEPTMRSIGLESSQIESIIKRRPFLDTTTLTEIIPSDSRLFNLIYIGLLPQYYRVRVEMVKPIHMSKTLIFDRGQNLLGLIP